MSGAAVEAGAGSGAGLRAAEGRVRRGELAAFASLAGFVVIGSSTAVAAKFAVRELPVGLLPLVRFGVAGVCLLPLIRRDGLRRMIRDDGRRLFLAAACCVPINQAFFLHGAKLVPVTHTALIYATCPLVVLALTALLGQERWSAGRLVGALASVVGVAVLALGNFRGAGVTPVDAWLGDGLLVVAVLSWAAYLTLSKPLIARHGAMTALAGTYLVGCVLDLPVAAATWPSWWGAMASASGAAWRGLAYLTLVVSLVGLALQNQAMRRLDASQVATMGNMAAVLTVVWGVLLFRDPITPALTVGGTLTIGGALWSSASAPR